MSTYNKINRETLVALEAVVGAEYVLTAPEILDKYKTDEETNPRYFHIPEVVVIPGTTQEIAEIVKLANKFLVPITVRGAGTSLSDGAIAVCGGIVLLMERMNKILSFDEEGMYMVVEAGVSTKAIQDIANSKKLLYAGDPCSAESCMIGGNLATNAGGNKAVRYGTTRDQVYALEVVTPTGDIVNMGARLQKKTTGYCLEQLLMGSEGTLGIITKATLKLKPLPPYRFDILAIFTDVTKAIDLVPKIIKAGVTPTSIEFMDNNFVRSTNDYCETRLPHYEDGSYIIITVETLTEDELDIKMELLDSLCTESGAAEVLEADERVWNLRRNCQESVRIISKVNLTDDVVVPLDKEAETIKFVMSTGKNYNLHVMTLAHAGDGNLHICLCKGDLSDEQWDKEVAEFHAEIYAYAYKVGGRLSGEHGIGAKKIKELEKYTEPSELAVMKTIKKAMDPNNILNPGKVVFM
ncbi:putative FAD-linked oxidoreductase [bioreactor metagenome]|uniref:Putative FAD-linked oxidoreductase n=1 Tax=bioreactor metagenome TaxID=1076179 RepID=A0A644VC22_9ZZZZ|nr:FAD-binding oxidoreductase [Acidaminococcaceae bacterium]